MLPILLVLASARAEEVHRYALIVGTNDGGTERVTLRYAQTDAQTMADILGTLGGVSSSRSAVLLDPGVQDLRAAFSELGTEIAADDGRTEVIFYYSGHSDEEGLLLGDELFGYRELRSSLDGLGAKVRLAILDSCASGSLILSKGGTKVTPFLPEAGTSVDGVAYITSSSADEASQEGDRVGGSYFTHYLASGLRGAADLTGDGRVTLNEAYVFARDETLERTERTQHGPQHASYDFQLSGSGELVLTDLTRRDASVVIAEGVGGHVVVRDDEGRLVAELDKPADRQTHLAVPAGDYVVTVLPEEGGVLESSLRVDTGETSMVDTDGLAAADAEDAVARGDLGPRAAAILDALKVDREGMSVMLWPGVPEPPGGVDRVGIGLLTGRSEVVQGFAFGTFYYDVSSDLDGYETSFGIARAQTGSGLQSGMVGNVTAGAFDGAQLTLGANSAHGGIRGIQVAMGANWAAGGFRGWQTSLGLNRSGSYSEGTQLAMGANVARDLRGLQLAAINVARDTVGGQVGLINVGRDVHGVQLGLINVANDSDLPIGLLSFVKEGRHDLLLYASESDWVNGELRLGGPHTYTLLGGGFQPDRHWYAAYGIGGHATFGKAWLDLDAVQQIYLPMGASLVEPGGGTRSMFDEPPTGVIRLRTTVGFQILPELAPFAGAALSARIPVDARQVDMVPALDAPDNAWVVWPGFFAGVQF
ncbi:MAG: caspase family protein [Myxococcales bacterium]|nr:caspase family protein [Myxococcales bacterium]